ncbi:TIM-barrel domain-containing protein [Dorea sp. YH-dor226]|uniref:glycoside hydrolase family 31 protein n=1 Tax=Dorea sp. YH-dor226 TaxID=3151119 RepID=UPI00324215CE
MICKYVFGHPMDTHAVVMEVSESKQELTLMQAEVKEDAIRLSCRMEDEDVVFGLGEQVRGMNKRGFSYISNATDDPHHTENKHSLYGVHNFLILNRAKKSEEEHKAQSFGIFVDDPGTVIFDVGETRMDELAITAGKDCVVYVVEGECLKDIVKQFRKLIGTSYIAPKWAFGYQQSRWSYMTEDEVREVVDGHHQNGIPLDAVYLDIDYMERYKDFTVNQETFPDFKNFTEEMKERGVHLVPIIDAGVKIEEGYQVYEEGVQKNYFCKDEDGEDFVAAVWPGKVHFPDVLNAEARAWFGGKYRFLMEQGIDGFWNDMNEPAIFYSEKNLKKVLEELDEMKGKNLDLYEFFHMRDLVSGLSNSAVDYQSFYHNMDGVKVRHDKVHNLYGFNMTRAAAEAFDQIAPDRRTLLFSRSSYIGMHRYGGIWTGDNNAWWSQLLLSIQQMPSLNMCGILYTGSDIGGFGSDTTEDLMMRWLEFALFTPLMRNHAAMGTRRQEVYRFERLESFRNIIRMRYGLLPYIYSEYMKAVLKDEMYFRPLAFDYPEDEQAYRVEDQLLVGESIMIAPVYVQNAKGRYVYLPEDMLMVSMRSLDDRTCKVLPKGHHYIDVAIDEVVLFVRKGYMLPLAVLDVKVRSTGDVSEEQLQWIGYTDDVAEYVLYSDDGLSRNYTPQSEWKKIRMTKEELL